MLDEVNDWLQNRKHDGKSLGLLFTRLNAMVTALKLSGHLDTTKWLDLQHNREEVEHLLTNKRVGTFVIRRSNLRGYALSILYVLTIHLLLVLAC